MLVLQRFFNSYAGISLPNPASVRLHEAIGFRPVGVYRGVGYKLGAWHDVGWWELSLRKQTPHPDPPLDLPAVWASEEWPAALASGFSFLRDGG